MVAEEKIVLCKSYKVAKMEFERLIRDYPFMWVKKTVWPKLSLTSIYGIRYLFYSEQDPSKLRGTRLEMICIDEIDLKERNNE